MACLNTFVLRIIIQFQHGFRTIDAKQDNISFGLVHLVSTSNRVLFAVVTYSLRYPAIHHPLLRQFCSNHRKVAFLSLVNCVQLQYERSIMGLSRVVSQTVTNHMWFRCDSDSRLTPSYLAQMRQELPLLRDISLSEVSSLSELPKAQIKTDEDLEHWKSMQSYQDYILFLRRLNESVVGTSLPCIPEHRSQVWFVSYFWFAYFNRNKSPLTGYLSSSILSNNGSLRSRLFNRLSALGTWLSEHGANN